MKFVMLLHLVKSCVKCFGFLDSRKKANLSTVLSVTELNSCLIEIRKNFLAKLSEVLPVAGESHDTLEVQLQKIMSGNSHLSHHVRKPTL